MRLVIFSKDIKQRQATLIFSWEFFDEVLNLSSSWIWLNAQVIIYLSKNLKIRNKINYK